MCAKSRTLFARVVSVHTGTRTGTTLTILFMYKKILLVSVWLIVSLLVVSLLCEMLSASDTISNSRAAPMFFCHNLQNPGAALRWEHGNDTYAYNAKF